MFQVPRLTYLLLVFPFECKVKAFNAIPYYTDKVYDPDPDGSDTKAKLERLKVPVTLFFFLYFGRKVKSSMDTNLKKKTIKLFTSFHRF